MYIKRKQGMLQKLVFEVQYNDGYSYLDKCGRTMNTILRQETEWTIKNGQPDAGNAALVSLKNSATFNFNSFRLNLFLEKSGSGDPLLESEIDTFMYQCEALSNLVIEQLGISDFTRIGFRFWYLFGTKSKAESQKWILDLGLYNVNPEIRSAFKGEMEASNFSIIIAGEERKFRIAIDGIENQTQIDIGNEILNVRASKLHEKQNLMLQKQLQAKRRLAVNPSFGVVIDIDIFQDNPISIDVQDFILTSRKQFEEGFTTALKNK